MKVTHIITSLDVGGAELALKNIVEYSEKNGVFYNRVISLTRVGAVGEKLQALGIEVTALNMRGFFDMPRGVWQLTKLLKKQNPEIVQTWLYHADFLGGIAARFAGIKKIFWGIRSTDILAGKGVARSTYFIMKICARFSYFIPHNIVCVAQAAMKTHLQFGYCPEKLQVIYNGFNADTYNDSPAIKKEIRDRFSIPDDAIVIGSVGRFNEYKDHKNFIDAAATLAANNKKIVFLLIGRDITPQNALLMQWINNTGFRDNFILVGESNEINLCYAAMNIFCLHSKSEAFPNVVVEAMLSAIPCVVTNVGDGASIVGELGIVVPAQEHRKLSEGLQKIINLSPDERVKLGKESRAYATQKYSLETAVRKYEALYKHADKNKLVQTNVTHIITDLNVGGAELSLKNLVQYSEKNSIFHNKVISLTNLGPVGKKLQESGVEVFALNMRGFFDVPRVLWQLTKLLKKQNPESVQTWLYHADLLGGVASRLAGIKNIYWGVHSTDILVGKGTAYSTYFVMKFCTVFSYFIPRRIICVAKASMLTHQRLGYYTKKMCVIPNGCNVPAYNINPASGAKMRKQLSIPEQAIVIGSVGRFNEYKDHMNLILAAAKLVVNNCDLVFMLVGRDITTQNAVLMQWINDNGVRDNFILLGERNDVNLCFNAMDIFCLHSRSEALPNVISEAMCSGVPCVVTDVGDCASMLGGNGMVVPAENPEALAQGIQKIINLNVQERLVMGKRSRDYAIQNYSLEAAVRKYEALYKEG